MCAPAKRFTATTSHLAIPLPFAMLTVQRASLSFLAGVAAGLLICSPSHADTAATFTSKCIGAQCLTSIAACMAVGTTVATAFVPLSPCLALCLCFGSICLYSSATMCPYRGCPQAGRRHVAELETETLRTCSTCPTSASLRPASASCMTLYHGLLLHDMVLTMFTTLFAP